MSSALAMRTNNAVTSRRLTASTSAAPCRAPVMAPRRAPSVCRFKEENGKRQLDADPAEAGTVESGLVFQPEQAAAPQVRHLDELMSRWQEGADVSYSRSNFAENAEAAINEQINAELVNSHVYLQMSSYFSRDGVSLLGFASFFRKESYGERGHAEQLMEYQTRRGGRTKLGAIGFPPSEFNHPQKGGVLNACEMALALERLNFERLKKLHAVAEQNDDADMANFVEEMLDEQSKDIREATILVTEVQRAGTGHGIVYLDKILLDKYSEGLNLGPHPFA